MRKPLPCEAKGLNIRGGPGPDLPLHTTVSHFTKFGDEANYQL